jgi:hypothetical protein
MLKNSRIGALIVAMGLVGVPTVDAMAHGHRGAEQGGRSGQVRMQPGSGSRVDTNGFNRFGNRYSTNSFGNNGLDNRFANTRFGRQLASDRFENHRLHNNELRDNQFDRTSDRGFDRFGDHHFPRQNFNNSELANGFPGGSGSESVDGSDGNFGGNGYGGYYGGGYGGSYGGGYDSTLAADAGIGDGGSVGSLFNNAAGTLLANSGVVTGSNGGGITPFEEDRLRHDRLHRWERHHQRHQ